MTAAVPRVRGRHADGPRATTRRPRGLRSREAIAGYLFISPWIVGFLVFTLGSMGASLVI